MIQDDSFSFSPAEQHALFEVMMLISHGSYTVAGDMKATALHALYDFHKNTSRFDGDRLALADFCDKLDRLIKG